MRSNNGLLTTVAYSFKDQKPVYALEGSIAVAGAVVKFLRDNLNLISSSDEIGTLAEKVEGQYFVDTLLCGIMLTVCRYSRRRIRDR